MMVSSSQTWDMSWSLSAIPGIFSPERGWCLISDLYQFTAVNTRFQSLRLVHTGDSGPSSAGCDGAHRRPGAKRPRISSHCSSPYVTTVTPCVVVVVTTMPIAVTTVAHVATAMVEPQSMTISTLPMPVAHEYQGYLNQEHSLSLPISPHTSLGTQQQHWTGMPFSTPQLDTMQICDDAYQAVTDASTWEDTHVTLSSPFTPCPCPCKSFPCIRVLVLAGLSRQSVSSWCKLALAT